MEDGFGTRGRRSRWPVALVSVLLAVVLSAPSAAIDDRRNPAQSSPGYIGSPILEAVTDPDGDGFFDAIVLTVPFVINETGTWDFYATLYSGPDWATANLTTKSETPGTDLVMLGFIAWPIRRFQRDGPYPVNISMSHQETRYSTTANYTTAAYAWSDLEFLVEIQGPFSERPIDADGDGLYNYLAVSGQINASSSAQTRIEGRLYAESGTVPFTSVYNVSTSVPGLTAFEWRFSGDGIRRSGADGIYRIELQIFDFGNTVIYQTATIFTRAYLASQFFHEPIAITGPPAEHGVDFDGNGLYDVLRIDVPVEVRLTGAYRVFGSLESGWARISGYTLFTLAVGETSAHVDIDGFEILKTYNAFSYQMLVSIVEDASPFVVETTGTTDVLPSNEFDNPFGNIATFTVTPVNDDGDAEFESVRLEATIRVKQEASFSGIFAIVTNPSNTYWDEYFLVRGNSGFVSASITFPGWRLHAMGWNGTYGFLIMMGAGGYNLENRFIERNFTYDEFEPALRLRGPISLTYLDNDQDGKDNQLVVHVPLHVEIPGPYRLMVTGRDGGGGGTGATQSRYLEPLDFELTIGLSGIALSAMRGPTLNVTFSALLSFDSGNFAEVARTTTPFPFDPARFQTATYRTVTFHVTAPEPVQNPYVVLVNYPNAFTFGLSANQTGDATASLPDLDYDVLVFAYARSSPRLYGQAFTLSAPLVGPVALAITQFEYRERNRTIALGGWSSGIATTRASLVPTAYYRFLADLNLEPDGLVSLQEIANVAALVVDPWIPPSVSIDDVPLTDERIGQPEPFGEGSVLSAAPIGFRQEYLLTGSSATAPRHRIRVNLTREVEQVLESATVRIPAGWKVESIDAPGGVEAVQRGPREVSMRVLTPAYGTTYPVEIAAIPDSNASHAEITGRVEDYQGRPVEGAVVRLFRGTTLDDTQVTSADGSFAFTSLAGDTYRLNVSANGYRSRELTVSLPEGQSLFFVMALPLTSEGERIFGRIVDSSGHGIAGATVSLWSGATRVSETTSNATGGFRLDNVPAGSYTLRVEAAGFALFERLVRVDLASSVDVEEIVLEGAGQSLQSLVVPAAIGIVIGVGAIAAVLFLQGRRGRRKIGGV